MNGQRQRPNPPRNGSDELVGRLIIGLAAVLVVLSGLGWLAAGLTSLVCGHGWPVLSLPQAARFARHAVRHGDPAAAWTTTVPGEDPLGPSWVFWTITALLLVALAAGAAFGTRVWLRRPRRTAQPGVARWASRAEERRIAVPDNPAGRAWRLVAGRSLGGGSRLLAGDDCISAVAFGPNGSGKTTGLVIPNVLEWDGPVVMTTAKAHDLPAVYQARKTRGPVWVLAPGGAPGYPTATWSPVDYASDETGADRVAQWLVEASGMTGDPRAKPWNAQARKYLKGLLLAAHVSGGGIAQWVEWIYAGERARDTVDDLLRVNCFIGAAREYASTWAIHEEGKGSVLFTAFGLADAYTRATLAHVEQPTDPADTLSPDAVFDQGGTVLIVAPQGEADRHAPIITALLSALIHEAETRAATSGGPIRPRLLLALDEAGSVFRYPRLGELLTTARGNGIQLLLIYHDLAQLERLYAGREVARTVLSNAKLRLLLPGVADLDTLRYWSQLAGRTRTRTMSQTRGDGRHTTSTSEHPDELAPLHLLQQLPDGQGLLLYQNLPPMQIALRPWYADPALRRLAEHAAREPRSAA